MLELIMTSSQKMPDYVFHYFVDNGIEMRQKPFYNLIADTFLTLFAYCKLMRECAWSQAYTLLRMGIEQVAAIFIMSNVTNSLEQYLLLYSKRCEFVNFDTKEKQRQFCDENGIPKNRVNDYFDYGWVANFTKDKTYGKKQMIELARLDEFIVDIEETLNAFAHGSISVFQMSKDNWRLMKDYSNRACLICCKLYDFLCCSYHNVIGHENFVKIPLNDSFSIFKNIWRAYSIKEGWIKSGNK